MDATQTVRVTKAIDDLRSEASQKSRTVVAGFQVDGHAEVLTPHVEKYPKMTEIVVGTMGVWNDQTALPTKGSDEPIVSAELFNNQPTIG